MAVPRGLPELAKLWGHEMRKLEAKASSIQGTMGRIREEGPTGAAIKGQRDYVPSIDFPDEVQRFHMAWRDLDFVPKTVIYVHYKQHGKAMKKAAKLGMNKSKYYREIRKALREIASTLFMYE